METNDRRKHGWGLLEIGGAVGVCLLALLGFMTPPPRAAGGVVLGAYGTDLDGRTPHQRYNARRAAAAINGAVIPPGGVFSFNRAVRGWSADRGYLKAPVSYDGVLVDDYGGGVCQCSTTLYNAALLAGLPILERHPHTFAPGYVPPGRDAAVAYAGVDLRFRNPYAVPLTVDAAPDGQMLVCRITGRIAHAPRVTLRSETLDRFAAPPGLVSPGTGLPRARWHLSGREGVRVVTLREYSQGGRCARREVVSDDTYRAISSVQWVVGQTRER